MHQKGNCYAVMGKHADAMECINQSISKAPTNLHYRYSLAALHILKDEFKTA